MTALNVDMAQILKQFSDAVSNGLPVRRGEVHKDICVHADHPNNITRFTYGILSNGEVIAIASFVQRDSNQDLPCFHVGYAVKLSERRKNYGTNILKFGLDELKLGLKKIGISEFYAEAIVELDNLYSQKIAGSVLKVSP